MTDAHPPAHGLDTAGNPATQDVWDTAAIRRGHLRVRTLVNVRWMVIVGETVLLIAMGLGLGYPAPYGACAAVIAAGVAVNVATSFAGGPMQRVLGDREAVGQLGLDILQLAALIGLLGGTANPFVLVLIAPVTLAAATLPLRPCCWWAASPRCVAAAGGGGPRISRGGSRTPALRRVPDHVRRR